MQILDGKKLAQQVREQLKTDIQNSAITPGIAAVLVGDDPASHIYINLKEKAAREIGMHFERVELPENTNQDTLIKIIKTFNTQNNIHGILVQLPLPKHIDTNKIIRTINPNKDADGFHPDNINLIRDGKIKVMSPTHAGILAFLEETGIELEGKKIALLVNSNEFGDPLADLLTMHGTEVANLIKKKGFQSYTQKADILIVAVGQANLIQADDIKKDAVIIDVGTNKVNNKLVGDVDFESIKNKVSWITPVPGGVGPMTVAYLLKNTFELALLLKKNRQ